MYETMTVFGLTVYAYGLFAALGAALLLAGMRAAGRGRLPRGTASVFGALGIALGVICARLAYCLCNLSTFVEIYENPWLMLRFMDGGLSMTGLAAGFVLAGALTARLMKARMADVMDCACLPGGLLIAALRLGEQFTDLGVGKAVEEGFATAHFPWLFVQSRMGVAVEYRMNVWAYEAVAALAAFVVTLLLWRRLRSRSGDTALLFACLFGASQVLLDSLRDDGHLLLVFLRIGQLGAAALPLAACGMRIRRAGRKRRIATWVGMTVCVAAVVVLEFSLDGRLAIGEANMARDYAVMAVACAAFGAFPVSLLFMKDEQKG